jgi:large subunit ribosomal protein L19
MSTLKDLVEKEYLKSNIPDFSPGDTLKVHHKIIEGGKERIQVFEGVVIRIRGGGINKTFTLRKISQGIGVEKTFYLHSPYIEKINVVRKGKVRRAKLYYLRGKIGKTAKIEKKEEHANK